MIEVEICRLTASLVSEVRAVLLKERDAER